MTDILNADDLYHTGIVVSHLDAAIAKLTTVAGYEWTTPMASSLPVQTEIVDRSMFGDFNQSSRKIASERLRRG